MKRFRIAAAGCGLIADEWVKYALTREDAEIVALVDVNNENANAMARKYQLKCRCYEDIEDAIKSAGANLVFDTTIVTAHKDIVVKSIKAGCDVFGEKPMAFTMEEAVDRIKLGTRHLAKRQITWFRSMDSLKWLDTQALGKRAMLKILVDSLNISY